MQLVQMEEAPPPHEATATADKPDGETIDRQIESDGRLSCEEDERDQLEAVVSVVFLARDEEI